MKKYTTVIFDLDGTLLDTLYDLCDGVNIALRAYHMPEKTIDAVRMAVGNGVEKLMERTVPGGHANPQFDECLARFRTEYAKIAADRRSQVGTGDRSERIRTYNFPQGRVSDHRIGLTLYSLESFLNGNIGEMVDALATADAAERLKGEEQ